MAKNRMVAVLYSIIFSIVIVIAAETMLIAQGTETQIAKLEEIKDEQKQSNYNEETEGDFQDIIIRTEEDYQRVMEIVKNLAEEKEKQLNEQPDNSENNKESRYQPVTDEEREMLACLVWLEARGESLAGQQACAEVVLNRREMKQWPDTIEEVIYDKRYGVQFSPAKLIPEVTPTQDQYDAVDAAIYGENILPMDVVYFSTKAQNTRIWGKIGNHTFCYA